MTGSEKKKDRSGVIVFALIALFIIVPMVWGLYDEGAFEGKEPNPDTAPVFGPRESGRLVERLDTAAKAQGVCYGWIIDSGRSYRVPKVMPSYDPTFSPRPSAAPQPSASPTRSRSPRTTARPQSPRTPRVPRTTPTPDPTPTELDEPGVEFGSNLGAGVDPRQRPRNCPRWVVLTADYDYSILDEEWRSGSLTVDSNVGLELSNSFEVRNRLGVAPAELTADNGIGRLADAIGGLPLLAAEDGKVRPVAQAAAQAPPSGDKISGRSAGDYIFMGSAIALIAGGVLWIVVAAVRSRKGTS